jgi:fructose-1,6-bisphosphatase/inositol monophosphatase family enzyme
MSLKKEEQEKLLEIAKDAVLKAGNIIADHFGDLPELSEKEGGENLASCVVTEVDLKSQQAIVETLKASLDEYKLGLLAEESEDDESRFEKDYFWCVDPLDGTLVFSLGQDGFSVSIGLVSKEGEAILGAIYNPKTQDLYHGLLGGGAFKNNSPLTLNTDSKKLSIFFDHSYRHHEKFDSHIKEVEKNAKAQGFESIIVNPQGGAVMNAIGVAENSPAIYYKLPKKEFGGGSLWDFAASSLILKEMGCFIGNYDQSPLHLNSKSVFMNEKGILFASSQDLCQIVPKAEHE